MRIPTILVHSLILSCAVSAYSQQRITFSTGYGTYAMADLADFQDQLTAAAGSSIPVPLTPGSYFPGYYNFELSFVHVKENFLVGGNVGYGSTGARSGYSDYSGSYYIDQDLKYVSLLGTVGYHGEFKEGMLLFEMDLRPGIVFTMMDIAERVGIGTTSSESSVSFQSVNIDIQPTFTLTRKFSSFGVQALAGYHISIVKSKLHLSDNSEAFLIDNKGDNVVADWSGLRLSLGLSYFF